MNSGFREAGGEISGTDPIDWPNRLLILLGDSDDSDDSEEDLGGLFFFGLFGGTPAKEAIS